MIDDRAAAGGRTAQPAARPLKEKEPMSKVLAGITISVDGFITGTGDGPGDLIRQALAAGLVDELTIIIAPVTLGAGKRLFEGFGESLELEHLGVRQSPFATFISYRVKNEGGES
jgi:hypothetical protein